MGSEASPSARLHEGAALFDHPSTLAKIERLLAFLPARPLAVVDAGCGDGRLAEALAAAGHAVTGLDANAAAVRAAAARGIDARVADLESSWPLPDASADLVLLADTLEHLADPARALAEARRVLRPDGHAIVVFPNHFDLRQRLETLLGRGIVHWSHHRYPDASAARYAHLRFLRLAELLDLFRVSDFRLHALQFNFMGGGLVPRRLTPRAVRIFLARTFPDLFSGKFGALLQKSRMPDTKYEIPLTIALPETPHGV